MNKGQVMKPIISCPNCKEAFEQSRIDKQYCSRVCKTKAKEKRPERKLILKAKKRPYIIYKKAVCELCGFIPVHTCQLDVDHIDGDHSNNSEENLQTLCANCHRLKTFLCKDNH